MGQNRLPVATQKVSQTRSKGSGGACRSATRARQGTRRNETGSVIGGAVSVACRIGFQCNGQGAASCHNALVIILNSIGGIPGIIILRIGNLTIVIGVHTIRKLISAGGDLSTEHNRSAGTRTRQGTHDFGINIDTGKLPDINGVTFCGFAIFNTTCF